MEETAFDDKTKLLSSETSASPGSPDDADGRSAVDYESYLQLIGVGRFHVILLLLCGWANASDACELMAISFVITSPAECSLLLDSNRKGLLTASLFLGMMVGGWVWGVLSDRFGRRTVLMIAMLVNALAGMGSAFVSSFAPFIFLRIISGVGVGGSIPVVFSYFCEFLPAKNRGAFLVGLASFWMVGSILCAGLAWLVLSDDLPAHCSLDLVNHTLAAACKLAAATGPCGRMSLGTTSVDSWRFFMVLAGVPALLTALGMLVAPESPKWQLCHNQKEAAERTLNKIMRVNKTIVFASLSMQGFVDTTDEMKGDEGPVFLTSTSLSCLPVVYFVAGQSRVLPTVGVLSVSSVELALRQSFHQIQQVLSRCAALYRPPFRKNTVVLSAVWFSLSFGFYGISLWLPEYFKHGGIDGDTNIYQTSFYVALSNLPGNLFAAWSTERFSRKFSLAGSCLISGLAVFFIWFVKSTLGTTVFACIFAAVSVVAWNALDVVAVELYPTNVRTTAFGMQAATGRVGAMLGNYIFGQFAGSNIAVPLVLTSAALAAGGLASLMLPNTTGRAIH